MVIKYLTGWFTKGGPIQEVEVEKETDKSIWIDGNRESKNSDHAQYHDTWDDAKAFLLKKAEKKLNKARRFLELAQGEYGIIKGLKKPD